MDDTNKKFDHIDSKLDRIVDKLTDINITLAAQHVTLVDHTRRSDLLEKKLVPVERHVAIMNAVFKIVGVLAGPLFGLLKMFHKI